MSKIKKVTFRLIRILMGKWGIYGVVGKGNKYARGSALYEDGTIGNYNYIGPFSMINNAIIGNYCSIGPGVKIGQGNHSKDYITTYQRISGDLIGHSLNTSPAIVGNDVWCGANVVILQGVKVGDGAVIGANAVVTHDIPDYAIAIGVPAKVINYRFSPDKIEIINKSKWYDYNIDGAKKIIKTLEVELEKTDKTGVDRI